MIGDNFLKTMENTARLSVAYIVLGALFLLNVVSWPFIPDSLFKPYLVLIVVYYWSIYRPTLMPTPLCFAIGLSFDLITGTAPGLFAGIFVLTYWIVRNQRRFLMGQTYIVTWAIFSIVAFAIGLTEWFITGLVDFHWNLPFPWLLRAALTALIFPFISILLILVHRTLPAPSRTPA